MYTSTSFKWSTGLGSWHNDVYIKWDTGSGSCGIFFSELAHAWCAGFCMNKAVPLLQAGSIEFDQKSEQANPCRRNDDQASKLYNMLKQLFFHLIKTSCIYI
jgi:hypothetical protein